MGAKWEMMEEGMRYEGQGVDWGGGWGVCHCMMHYIIRLEYKHTEDKRVCTIHQEYDVDNPSPLLPVKAQFA